MSKLSIKLYLLMYVTTILVYL